MHELGNIIPGKITPFQYCGKTCYSVDVACIMPGLTEPTLGEHDFNTCEDCQKTLKVIARQMEKKFKTFPNCCEDHRELLKQKWFNKDDFKDVPKQVSTKVVYTRQHIINNISKDDWYKDITDYIAYTYRSFGQLNHMAGLFFSDYVNYILEYLNNNEAKFSPEKTKLLKGYIENIGSPKNSQNTPDFNVLLTTYEKWINLFPFDISFFRSLKEDYKKRPPILTGEPIYNKYLDSAYTQMHTKESLIELLIARTDELLTNINTYTLNEAGKLKDVDKVRYEIVIAERKNKIKLGYGNKSIDEDARFRKILKEWYRDEKKFIDDIKPYLKDKGERPDNTKPELSKSAILQNEFEKLGFMNLPMIKGKLSENNLKELFDLLSVNKAPYQIAMLHFLGLFELAFRSQSKEKVYRLVGKILNAKERIVKGNCLVLNSKSTENRTIYTSHLYTKEVEKEYNRIKLG